MGLWFKYNHMAAKGRWGHWHEKWGDGADEHYWVRCGFVSGETEWLPVCMPIHIRVKESHLAGGWRRSARCKDCKAIVDAYIKNSANDFYVGS